eukprot:Amastigsp_a841847_15.p4 type:complete len:141 gc:universal Amastigsp_a841847_15:1350-928(-)
MGARLCRRKPPSALAASALSEHGNLPMLLSWGLQTCRTRVRRRVQATAGADRASCTASRGTVTQAGRCSPDRRSALLRARITSRSGRHTRSFTRSSTRATCLCVCICSTRFHRRIATTRRSGATSRARTPRRKTHFCLRF